MKSINNKDVWIEFFKLKFWELFLGIYMTVGVWWIGGHTYQYGESKTFFDRWLNGLLFNLILVLVFLLIYVWLRANWNWAIKRIKARRKER